MAEYFLAPNVHFCCRGDAVVFLDAKHDNYVLINGETAKALRYLSSREPVSASLLAELLDAGLLTTDSRVGRRVEPTLTTPPAELLVEDDAIPTIRVTSLHVWHFVCSCLDASARLRWSRFDDIVGAVERRKHLRAPGELDVAKARRLTAAFNRLRALFPRNYLCLYDSLALIQFLARHDVFPEWVFGVRLEPWAAHCWVQHQQYIFNEEIEEAAGYTPVMAV